MDSDLNSAEASKEIARLEQVNRGLRSKYESLEKPKGTLSYAASQARLLQLTSLSSDMKLQADSINTLRRRVATKIANLITQSAAARSQAEKEDLAKQATDMEPLDRALELQLRKIDTLRDAIGTEIDAIKRIVGRNIEDTFSTFG